MLGTSTQEDELEPSKQEEELEPSKQEEELEPYIQEDELEPSKQEDVIEPSKQEDELEPSKQEDELEPSKQEDVLGTYIHEEELGIEFKELYLTSDNIREFLNRTEIFNIIKNGTFTEKFDNAIYDLLSSYITKILPKYISCFGNAQINGVIYIGVNDFAEITGIPTLNKIDTDKIKYNVIDIIRNNINSELTPEELATKISVEFIPLQCNIDILHNDTEKKLKYFSRKILQYNDQMDKYNTKTQLWLIKYRRYSQKLIKIINIPSIKKELISYIKNSTNPSSIIIQLLEEDEYINIDLENIQNDRLNKDTVFYWLTLFRDKKLKKLQKVKKQINKTKPILSKIQCPTQILCDLSGLRYMFIKNNANIKYYYIKISLNLAGMKSHISFFQNNKWKSRTRIMNDDGPSCI